MNEQEYIQRLQRLEADRRRLVGEMMIKPFGDRVMSTSLELELDGIECELLDNPPIVGRSPAGEPIYGGQGLREDTPEETERMIRDVPPLSVQVIPQSEWPAYIEGQNDEQQLQVKPYVEHILNQGSVGSCAADAAAGAAMAAENISGQKSSRLNGYFLYHWSSGGRDQGSTLAANVQLLQERGCASVEAWPRSKGFRREPSDEAKQEAKQHRLLKVERARNWEEFGTALLLPFPVQFGYPGHSIFAVRLISPERAEYANTWGRGFGDNGFGTINRRRIEERYGMYIYMSVSENRQ